MRSVHTLEEIRDRLEQLCERRWVDALTADEEGEYSGLVRLERDLLEARRLRPA